MKSFVKFINPASRSKEATEKLSQVGISGDTGAKESVIMMGAYLDFIRIRFLMMLAYRVNYYSGIIIYAINIGAYYFLWKAIYGEQKELGGLYSCSNDDLCSGFLDGARLLFQQSGPRDCQRNTDGSVAIQFIRPYNIYS